jgi:hypothetical protein
MTYRGAKLFHEASEFFEKSEVLTKKLYYGFGFDRESHHAFVMEILIFPVD